MEILSLLNTILYKGSFPNIIHMKEDIQARLSTLRKKMKEVGVQAYIIPSTDPHAGEYIPKHWEIRKWVSGFTGSAGTLVVTEEKAALWTDARYYLQGTQQLEGTGITLQKDGLSETPSITTWLTEVLQATNKVGFDGEVNTVAYIESLSQHLATKNITVEDTGNLVKGIWTDQPAIPTEKIHLQELRYAGIGADEKITRIHSFLSTQNPNGAIIITALDEIAWILNLRGNDVPYNPVFMAYLYIDNRHTILFVDENKLTDSIKAYLQENHIMVRPYAEIFTGISALPEKYVYIAGTANYKLKQALLSMGKTPVVHPSPIPPLKAEKNAIEIAGFRSAMERDGVALVKFLRWLLPAVSKGTETEISVSEKLESFRAQSPFYKGASFHTIAGYGANGAIVHYSATPTQYAHIQAKGLLLLDSGAQYVDGTTDITRTIAVGTLTEEEKRDYTLVLKGFIALSQASFIEGTCGTQLDVLARQFMWKEGINYGHGTGHGVGHYLNVHEGPHQIRMNNVPAPILAGYTVTNEPGIYRAGKHGIRTENILLAVRDRESEFGKFLRFETLTLCPIDKTPICTEMLTTEEKEWFNHYHTEVYRRLSPYLDKEECTWLKEATSAI